MKVIYLHQYFNTPSMSGGTRSFEMARRIVAAGHEVHMVTSYRADDKINKTWFETVESGINVHWLPVPYSNHMSYGERIKAFFRFALAARRRVIALKGDLVFATSTPLTISIPAVLASRRNRIPMVFEVRDLWPEMPIAMGALRNPILRNAALRLERWAYFNSCAVIALSPGMKQGVERTGYSASKVAVIPNSSDNTEFKYDSDSARDFRSKRPWLRNRPLLVYAGTFGRVNGVGYLVDLASELRKLGSDIRILLVGDGQERANVLVRAKEAGVYERNIYFERNMPKKNIPALLEASDMACSLFLDIPEMQVNSANKFFDALAAGKPVFLNYGGWMHELVEKNECGLAMWGKPVRDVAVIIERALHNKRWLEAAGKKARSLAVNEFDRDKLAAQLIAVLEAAAVGERSDFAELAPTTYL